MYYAKTEFNFVCRGHSSLSEVEILALNFEKNLKVRAANETTPMPQIFQQEQSKMYKVALEMGISTQQVAENFKTFESKKSSLYAEKHKKYPNNPENLDEIKIEGAFALTEDNKRFLISDTVIYDPDAKKNARITVFGSDDLLKVMCEGSRIASDGTFDFAANYSCWSKS